MLINLTLYMFYDVKMSDEPIYCFNDTAERRSECIYENCPMFSVELDMCKIELLKQSPTVTKKGVKKQREKAAEPKRVSEVDVTSITDLQPGDQSSKDHKINVRGTLLYDAEQRDVETRSGPTSVTDFTISDGTGSLKISFWGDAGKVAIDLLKGDKVLVENVYQIQQPYKDTAQANAGRYFRLTKL